MQLAARHVMVGQQQPVRADERSRPAVVQPHRGQADVIQPRLGQSEIVLLLDQLGGRIVEGPHAFVGNQGGQGHAAEGEREEGSAKTDSHTCFQVRPRRGKKSRLLHFPVTN